MEERIVKLEAISDSTVAAVAALRTDMNDRFKLVDTQLAELHRQKVETDVILGRLDIQADQIADLRQYIDQRFTLNQEEINLRFNQVDLRFNQVDLRFNQVDLRVDQVNLRLNQVEQRLQDLETQMAEQASQIKELRAEFRYMTRWIMGSQLAIVLFLLGLAAKIFYPS